MTSLSPQKFSLFTFAAAFLIAQTIQADQAADKAVAERLFESARQLTVAGKHADACPKYAESNRLDPGVGTLLYLADCYEKINRLASAWATWREAAGAAKQSGQKDRERIASGRAAALEKRLSNLQIKVSPAALLPGLVVTKNGDPVSPATFGASMPIDAGTYKLEASAPGRAKWAEQIDVTQEGATQIISIPVLSEEKAPVEPASSSPAPAVSSAPPPPPPPSPHSPPPPPPSSRKFAGYAVAGVGAVGLALGGFFGLRTFSKNDEAKSHCRTSTLCDPTGVTLNDQARSAATLSTVFMTLGAVGVGLGAALILTSPDQTQTAIHLRSHGPQGGLLSLKRTF